MNNTSKTVGFIQGAFYPIVWAALTAGLNYVIVALPAAGIVSPTLALIICGVLSQLENAIKADTGRSLFGFASN